MLGGPQAGIILGSEVVIASHRRNPLARALRLDKMTIAALDWTLDAMLDGRGEEEIPVLQMMLESSESLEARARDLLERLTPLANGNVAFEIETDRVPIGGGSLPGIEFDSWVVAIRRIASGPKPNDLVRALRESDVPVLARVRDEAVLIDLRTLSGPDTDEVVLALEKALR